MSTGTAPKSAQEGSISHATCTGIYKITSRSPTASDLPIPSFAKSNRELLEAFETYLVSRNRSAPTLRSYLDSVGRLLEVLGSKDAAELDRSDIRRLQSQLLAKGLSEN